MVVNSYAKAREELGGNKYLRLLAKNLKKNSRILDLGSGTGLPVASFFADLGHNVTGIDISSEMVNFARKVVPAANFFIKDMSELKPNEYKVDAVVCYYSMFHVPRTMHQQLLKIFSSYLSSGGLMLLTMGDKDFEGHTEYLGVNMWWSQWGPIKNSQMVERAGFVIEIDEVERKGGESHQIILARKI